MSAAPIALRVDEFRSDASVKIVEVEGKTVIGILKRALERTVTAEPGFKLAMTASLSLGGSIRELTITDGRRDNAGQVLQKSVQIRVDFSLLDEATGKPAVQRNNVIEELTYYTDTYSLEQGLTDREAIEEQLLVSLSKRIIAEIKKDSENIPRAPVKEVELSPEEKEILDQVDVQPPKPPEPRKPLFAWNLGFENEVTTIPRGTLMAAGQRKTTLNRFLQNTTLKLNPLPFAGGELRGLAISKYRPEDIRELTLQRGELELQANENALLKAGTVSQTLNKYIFDQTLAGATFDGKFATGDVKHNIVLLGGHDWRADGIGDLPRVNYGGFWKSVFGQWAEVQLTADATRDQHAFRSSTGATTDVDNRLYGASGKLKAPWKMELTFDANRSDHKELATPDTTFLRGDLLDLKLTQPIKNLALGASYYYADARFRTVYGSATTDREKLGGTAKLPGKWKWLDYALAGEWTRTNKTRLRTLVEQLGATSLNLTSKPWESSSQALLKNLAFSSEYSLRRTYDDVVVIGTTPGNNRRNFRYVLGAANTLWNHLKVSAGWSDERERDFLRNELQITQEYKTENTFNYDLTEALKMELKGNYRARDGGRDQDRFTTLGGTLAWERDALTARFDYLRDLKRGTVKAQNTDKDRFTLDVTYANEHGAFKNSFTLRTDYEINGFDNKTSDYDRWITTIGMKVIF